MKRFFDHTGIQEYLSELVTNNYYFSKKNVLLTIHIKMFKKTPSIFNSN